MRASPVAARPRHTRITCEGPALGIHVTYDGSAPGVPVCEITTSGLSKGFESGIAAHGNAGGNVCGGSLARVPKGFESGIAAHGNAGGNVCGGSLARVRVLRRTGAPAPRYPFRCIAGHMSEFFVGLFVRGLRT